MSEARFQVLPESLVVNNHLHAITIDKPECWSGTLQGLQPLLSGSDHHQRKQRIIIKPAGPGEGVHLRFDPHPQPYLSACSGSDGKLCITEKARDATTFKLIFLGVRDQDSDVWQCCGGENSLTNNWGSLKKKEVRAIVMCAKTGSVLVETGWDIRMEGGEHVLGKDLYERCLKLVRGHNLGVWNIHDPIPPKAAWHFRCTSRNLSKSEVLGGIGKVVGAAFRFAGCQ